MNFSKHLTDWSGVSILWNCMGERRGILAGSWDNVRAQKWGGGNLLPPPLPGKWGGERPPCPPCSYAYELPLRIIHILMAHFSIGLANLSRCGFGTVSSLHVTKPWSPGTLEGRDSSGQSPSLSYCNTGYIGPSHRAQLSYLTVELSFGSFTRLCSMIVDIDQMLKNY